MKEERKREEEEEEEKSYICAIDFGTQSVRVIIYDANEQPIISEQTAFSSIYLQPGWVQQNPREMVTTMNQTIQLAVNNFSSKLQIELNDIKKYIKAVGVTNQRETSIIWDTVTGEPLYDAIVWNDVRTAELVKEYAAKENAKMIKETTGLPISTYFSALKIKWMQENVPSIKSLLLSPNHHCCFGTVDCWLIWNLGKKFVTDVTNASRTMLMNLKTLQWDSSLRNFFEISPNIHFPEIHSSSELLAIISDGPLKGIPISGCLGDQQAALVGQKCLQVGQAKNTCGTGCFILLNAGNSLALSDHALSTVAFQLGPLLPPFYALEGAIATAGSAVSWLKDALKMVNSVEEVSTEASTVANSGDAYFVPAFSGLFAPHWRGDARGVLVGLTNFTSKAHICRAVLESVAYQTKDVLDAMHNDSAVDVLKLNVDGGMTNSKVFLQILADILGISVHCPSNAESTSLGAAFAAGLAVGVYSIDKFISTPTPVQVFTPQLSDDEREKFHHQWKKAVERSFGWIEEKK